MAVDGSETTVLTQTATEEVPGHGPAGWRKASASVLVTSLALLVGGGAAAQIVGPSVQPAEPGAEPPPCRLCHGPQGGGKIGINAPRLAAQYEAYLLKQLEDFATGERVHRLMSPIAHKLSEAEMMAMAEYYSVQDAPGPAYAGPDLPNLSKEQAFKMAKAIAMAGTPDGRVQACSDCHGPRGWGDPPFIPYIAGQLPDYLEHALTEFKTGKRTNDPYEVMQHVASGLTDEQISALAAYYAALPPRRPEPK